MTLDQPARDDDPYAPPTRGLDVVDESGPVPELAQRARVAQFMVIASVACSVAWVLVGEVAAYVPDASRWSEPVLTGFAYLALPISLASLVAFLIWLHRAVLRLKHAKRTIGKSPGWAVGCWFVPILNLYLPFDTIRELWRKSRTQRTLPPGALMLVRIWWTAFLISTYGSVPIAFMAGLGGSVEVAFEYAFELANLVAGAILVRIVAAITAEQRSLFQQDPW